MGQNKYSDIKKRRIYYKGLFWRFKIISDVQLTKEERSNIIFIIREQKNICNENVIARNIVKDLQETNIKVRKCTLLSNSGNRWIIKINLD